MPPFVMGLAIGAGAYYADGFLKDALHSHSDMIDITWVDLAVAGAALYFSPKGAGLGVVAGWVAGMYISGHMVTVPPAATMPVTLPPGGAPGAPAGSAGPAPAAPIAVTNPGPGFTNVIFTSGGGKGQM